MQIFADPAYTRTKRDIIDNLSAGTSYNCFIDRGFFPRKNNVNMSVLFFFYQFQNMSIPEMTDKGVTYLGKRNSIKYFSSFNSALLAKSNSTFLDYNHALLSQFPEFKKSCVKGMIFNGYASSRSRKHSSF